MPKGLYCATFGGGQVDITSGNFVFSATESYLIEDGKLTRPVRGASLIGNGPEALKYVSMVGNDLKLDEGIGVCGKEGQSVPVGVGIPTVKIDRMTVGWHRGMSELEQLASDAVKRALEAGATDAECTISEGEEFSAGVRMREVESLKEAGSRGAGIRVLVGRNTGSSVHFRSVAEGHRDDGARGARSGRRSPREDPYAGLPDADDLGAICRATSRSTTTRSRGMETEWKIAQARAAEETCASRRSAHSRIPKARRSIPTWARARSPIRAVSRAAIGPRAAD